MKSIMRWFAARAGDFARACILTLSFAAFAAAQSRAQTTKQTAPPTAPETAKEKPPTPDQLLQQAQKAMDRKDYATAATALESYLKQKPDDYRAEFNLAYVYGLSHREAEAIPHYQAVLAMQPDLVQAHMNLGLLLLNAQRPQEAVPHFRAVVEKETENAVAWQRLGEALAASKQDDEALDAWRHFEQLRPGDAHGQYALGVLLEKRDAKAAEEHYRRALKLDTSGDELMEDASLRLAYLLEERAESDADAAREAVEIYRSVLERHPDRAELHAKLGSLYMAEKQYGSAIQELEAARAAGLHNPAVNRDLVQAYLKQSEESADEAKKDSLPLIHLVQEILSADSGDAEMHLLLGKLLMDRKEYPGAAGEFNRAAKLEPQSAEAYRNLASVFYLMGEYQAALGALVKVAELKQDTAGSYFLRAITLDKLHVRRQALENYQQFLSLDGGKSPDQDFQARQRSRILTLEIQKGMK